jgi:hypothetical protein
MHVIPANIPLHDFYFQTAADQSYQVAQPSADLLVYHRLAVLGDLHSACRKSTSFDYPELGLLSLSLAFDIEDYLILHFLQNCFQFPVVLNALPA